MYVGGIVVMVLLVVVVPLFVTVHLWCKKKANSENADVELQGLARGDDVDGNDQHVQEENGRGGIVDNTDDVDVDA
jgi:hypothetical protein